MRMPRPSSPSVPTLNVPRASGGQCWRSMSSLKMKPPAVSTTPRRARSVTVSPKRCACTPTTRPSSHTRRSTRVSTDTAAPAPVAAAARCCMSSHPVDRFVLARWPRGAGRAISLKGRRPRRPSRRGPRCRSAPWRSRRRTSGRTGRLGPPASRSGPGSPRSSGRSWPRWDPGRRPPSCSGTCPRESPRTRRPSGSACPRRGRRCPRPARRRPRATGPFGHEHLGPGGRGAEGGR